MAALSVWAQSLGCPKNRVDTERLLGSLGVACETTPHMGRASLVFINTCAFIEPAARESIRAIIDAVERLEKLKKRPILAVAGCLPGRYGFAELEREFPRVDLWLEPKTQDQWPALLADKLRLSASGKGRLLSTGPSYAWLKIADGCDHRCSFCAIPGIRGPAVSEPLADILAEATSLLAQGVKELDIVAQDVLAWGRDKHGSRQNFGAIGDLLGELASLPNLEWLRLFYLYPAAITPDFLETVAKIGKPLLPYLDLPFQHSEINLLRSMGRPFTVEPEKTVALIRSILPQAALRATFIVGYPGETERDFERLCEFVEKTRFHNLGVFIFQAEEGTKAATLPFQTPAEIAAKRRDRLMSLQAGISREILQSCVGSRMDVLVDASRGNEWPGLFAGRVWFQGPEVDGLTYISGPGVEEGAMLKAEIVDSQIYDLSAMS